MEGERDVPEPRRWPRSSASSTGSCGVDPTAEQGWKGYAVSPCSSSASSRSSAGTSMLASRTSCRSTRPHRLHDPDLALNTAVSFDDQHQLAELLRRGPVSYLSQPAGLASATSPRPRPASPSPSRWCAASSGAAPSTIGNFWVDLTRGVALRPAADLDRGRARAGLAGRAADLRWAAGSDHPRRVRQQTIASDPSPRRSLIKELGTNGGGFFNANSAHPFENPTPLTNLLEMFAHRSSSRSRSPPPSGRYAGNQRQGWAIFARHGRRVARRRAASCMHGETAATRCSRPASTRHRRQHGGQGGPLRRRARRPVGRRDDRHEQRRHQLAARQPPAHRRARAAVQHAARRGHARAGSAPGCTGCSSSAPSSRSSSPG